MHKLCKPTFSLLYCALDVQLSRAFFEACLAQQKSRHSASGLIIFACMDTTAIPSTPQLPHRRCGISCGIHARIILEQSCSCKTQFCMYKANCFVGFSIVPENRFARHLDTCLYPITPPFRAFQSCNCRERPK